MQIHRSPEALAAEARIDAMNARYVREHRLWVLGPRPPLAGVFARMLAAVAGPAPEIDAGDDFLNGVPTHY